VARRTGVAVGLKSIAAHILSELMPLDGLGIQCQIYEGNLRATSLSIRRPGNLLSGGVCYRMADVSARQHGRVVRAEGGRRFARPVDDGRSRTDEVGEECGP
jgi:hypothetical protein